MVGFHAARKRLAALLQLSVWPNIHPIAGRIANQMGAVQWNFGQPNRLSQKNTAYSGDEQMVSREFPVVL